MNLAAAEMPHWAEGRSLSGLGRAIHQFGSTADRGSWL